MGMRRISSVLLVAVMLLIATCGIDTVSFLSQSPVYISEGLFTGPPGTDSGYLGVEIFYRMYEVETDAINDKSAFLSKQDEVTVPGDAVKSYLISDSYYRYRRVLLASYSDIPILSSTDLNSGSTTVLLTINTESESKVDFDGVLYDFLRRSLGSDPAKPFTEEPVVGDADLKSATIEDDDENIYYAQFFAASYGIDIANSSFNDLYSDAVYLGTFDLQY
ncbi:MAG: hypothetical protein E4H20_10595 [Spirochaetales bacterium]|nr:MAG: hypothetical protein E4H20_10595 [Spirochaetales bacterium]